jgi:hypothetical protein
VKRLLLVAGAEPGAPTLLALEVVDADMVFPGWLRFELESEIPDWEKPTVCWYRVPSEASMVELQYQIEDDDVRKRQAAADQVVARAPVGLPSPPG